MTVASSVCALVAGGTLVFGVVPVHGATTIVPRAWKNCTIVNKTYRHGVGRLRARDKTTGVPVTNFRRSTQLYNLAMRYNKGLDRDKDGIACEKH
jgi:hypothetical protein